MKKFWIVISLLAIIFSICFLLILFFVPAKIDGNLVTPNLVYFLITGYLAVALSSSKVLYSLQSLLKRPRAENEDQDSLLRKRTRNSLRRGFLLSTAFLVLVILQLSKTNNYLNTGLVLTIAVLFEIYWSNR